MPIPTHEDAMLPVLIALADGEANTGEPWRIAWPTISG
jgi:hypothetical protein